MLANAMENRAFSHIMVPKYSFIHPTTGQKVDEPDDALLRSIEHILQPPQDLPVIRRKITEKLHALLRKGELIIPAGKTILHLRNDHLLDQFSEEFHALMRHRKERASFDAEAFGQAFALYKTDPDAFDTLNQETKTLVLRVIHHTVSRFHYPPRIAWDTVALAFRNGMIRFNQILS